MVVILSIVKLLLKTKIIDPYKYRDLDLDLILNFSFIALFFMNSNVRIPFIITFLLEFFINGFFLDGFADEDEKRRLSICKYIFFILYFIW